MEEKEKNQNSTENGNDIEDIFSIDEFAIEELAIDGICGVY